MALVCKLPKIEDWKLDGDDNANKILYAFIRKQISTTFTQPKGYNEVENTICKRWLHKNQKPHKTIKRGGYRSKVDSTQERDKADVAVKTVEITGVKGAAVTRSVAHYLPGISARSCLVCIFSPPRIQKYEFLCEITLVS